MARRDWSLEISKWKTTSQISNESSLRNRGANGSVLRLVEKEERDDAKYIEARKAVSAHFQKRREFIIEELTGYVWVYYGE